MQEDTVRSAGQLAAEAALQETLATVNRMRVRKTPPHTMPGEVIARILYGSYAHGLDTADSDEDYRGVFQLPNSAFLGLRMPKTTHQEPPDQVHHEIGHYLNLLLKGNPNIVGMLFAPLDCVFVTSEKWKVLQERRSEYLSRQMASAYRGWIFKEMSTEKLTPKRLSHVPRLLYELESAVLYGHIDVRPTGWKREFIMDLKYGSGTRKAVELEVDRVMDEINAHFGKMPQAPVERTEALLQEFRG